MSAAYTLLDLFNAFAAGVLFLPLGLEIADHNAGAAVFYTVLIGINIGFALT